ncbi:MAG: hypothetical protein K8R68_07050 [Bacteroidales bacterium]|nr:hypothetical protein [Bacteroidales bacterium]
MTRKLTTNELRILKSIFYVDVEYSKVKLTNQHLFSYLLKKYSAIVFDNTIVFSKLAYKNDFSINTGSMALLVHEICHIWQYQNLNYRWIKAGIEHLKFGKSTYSYNIADHKKLTDYRFEQQGEIMADYYKLKQKNSPKVKVYEDIIYQVINKKV